SEEHTSELQSLTNLVCRLLLEKKKKQKRKRSTSIKLSVTRRLFAHSRTHPHASVTMFPLESNVDDTKPNMTHGNVAGLTRHKQLVTRSSLHPRQHALSYCRPLLLPW